MRSIPDMKSDEGFAKWIHREWPDEKIFKLVYNCYKAGIQTFWSNQGRVGQTLPMHNNYKAPNGFYVFDPGYLAYRLINRQTEEFHNLVSRIVKENSDFARFQPEPTKEKPEAWFFMDFQDISQKKNCLWTGYETDVVEASLGDKRLLQIDELWKYLTTETEKMIV